MMCSNSSRITRTIGATQAKATSFGKRSALKAQNCSLSMLVPGILLISAQMNIVGAKAKGPTHFEPSEECSQQSGCHHNGHFRFSENSRTGSHRRHNQANFTSRDHAAPTRRLRT